MSNPANAEDPETATLLRLAQEFVQQLTDFLEAERLGAADISAAFFRGDMEKAFSVATAEGRTFSEAYASRFATTALSLRDAFLKLGISPSRPDAALFDDPVNPIGAWHVGEAVRAMARRVADRGPST